jgi:hypothetical protein
VPEDPAALDEPAADEDAQLSLFEVLSAEVLDGDGSSVFDDDPDAAALDGDDGDTGVPFDLPPPPPPGGGRYAAPLPEDLGGRPLPEVKAELRQANSELATELARFTGLSHREVNGRLNRLAGLSRITEASLDQLRRRADQAERWLARL